jgi:hypothetical protein
VLQQAVKAVISATLARLLPYILHTFYDRCSSRPDVVPVPSVSAVQTVWPIVNHGIFLRISCTHYAGNRIEKNEMGAVCSTTGGEERCIQDFGAETGEKETTGNTLA